MVAARERSPGFTKVLLWKIGALGDVVMTTPLIRQLRKSLPRARIDFLTGTACVPILDGNPHLDRVLSFDERILFDAQVTQLGLVLKLLRGYDTVFILDKHWIFGALAWVAGIPVRVGFARSARDGFFHTHRIPYGRLRHEVQYYLDLARILGMKVDDTDVRLELPRAEAIAQQLPGKYVVVVNSGGTNPGEASEVRKMPTDLAASIVAACSQHDTVVFLGSARERPLYSALATDATINLCGQTTLRQSWHVLGGARAVYTTDTGLMHMAAAVNPNVVGIFGPTHPVRKCPPGAVWTWGDAALYDDAYEIWGKVPQKRFFCTLTARDVLNAGSRVPRSPSGEQPAEARRICGI